MKQSNTIPETTMIAVEPDGLIGIESRTPQWDRARMILEATKTACRASIAGQVILGGELMALKSELGFNGGGRRKELPHGAVINSIPRTWPELVRAELGISEDTGDRFIGCFKIIQKRGKALGDESETFRLLSAPPSTLNESDRKDLGKIVNELLRDDGQKELLQELKIVNGTHRLKGGDMPAKKAPADSGDVTVLASIHFRNLFNDLAKLEREVRRGRDDGNFKSFLYVLPLEPADSPDVVGLMDYRFQFEKLKTAIEEDLAGLLTEINKAIEPQMQGTAPKRVRKIKNTSRK